MVSYFYLNGSEQTFRYSPTFSESWYDEYARLVRLGEDWIYGSQYSDTIQPIFDPGQADVTVINLPRYYLGAGDDTINFLIPANVHGDNQYLMIIEGGEGLDTMRIDASSADQMISINYEDPGHYGVLGVGYTVIKSYEGSGNYFILDAFVSDYSVEQYIIKGSKGADRLAGGMGSDWLDGYLGKDDFLGSGGDDNYVFDTTGEKVTGETAIGGKDTIWTTVSVDLRESAFVENLRLNGSADLNAIGNSLANMITGNAGSNVIGGGAGSDSLYGKGGADTFHFDEMGVANKDFIWDFDADDKIQLGPGFAGLDLDNNGVVDAAAFEIVNKLGAMGTKAGPELIYNSATGILSYDADGAGKAYAAQDIAFIGTNKTFFDNSDIELGNLLLA